MNYDVIATGSTGNAVIVGNLLIDCGIAYRRISPRIGPVDFVLLTHAHRDHFLPSTAKLIADNNPLIRFICCPWMVAELVAAGVPKRRIYVMHPQHSYFVTDAQKRVNIKLTPFEVRHDVRNCGWKISFKRGKGNFERVFYVTDCANLNGIEAKGYDLYMVEANHREAEIAERIRVKEEQGVFCYEKRAAEVHLSREQAERFIADNAGKNSRYVYLHQHKEVT